MDVNPTDTFKDKLEITVDGIDLELYHAPGETNDQIIVWWPSERVLFPADNVYKAFPNLYAIRGTQARYEPFLIDNFPSEYIQIVQDPFLKVMKFMQF